MSLTLSEKLQAEKAYDDEKSHNGVAISDPTNSLPPPISAAKPRQKLSAAAIIPVWIILSSSVIIYNNYIYNTLNFKYPVFLVTWHLIFAVRLFRPVIVPCHT